MSVPIYKKLKDRNSPSLFTSPAAPRYGRIPMGVCPYVPRPSPSRSTLCLAPWPIVWTHSRGSVSVYSPAPRYERTPVGVCP